MIKQLIRFFVNNPLIVNTMLVITVILGGYLGINIKKESYPDVNVNILSISTQYDGGSLRDTELLVTKPIEEQLKSVSGIEYFQSRTSAGLSRILIWLDVWGIDKYDAVQNIREQVSIAQSKLPDGVATPQITEIKETDSPIIRYQLKSKVLSEADLNTIAKDVRDTLLSVSGIGRVELAGNREKQVNIMFDSKKLIRENVSILDLQRAISGYVVRQSAGSIYSPGNNRNISILTEFEQSQQLATINIRRNFEHSGISLNDVAKIEVGLEDRAFYVRQNQEPAITLSIYKEDGADQIRMVNKVYKIIVNLEKALKSQYNKLPASLSKSLERLSNNPVFMGSLSSIKDFYTSQYGSNIELVGFNDTTIETKKLLKITLNNLFQGMILSFLVLWLFLDIRIAFWTSFSTPLIMMAVFIVIFFLGYSINNILLFGFIMVLGILADDGIVVAENIYKYKSLGINGRDAAIKGTSELIVPLMGTLLTTICSFLPLLIVNKIDFIFIRQMPAVIIICLIISLVEVLCVFPSHLSHDRKNHLDSSKKKKEKWGDRTFNKIKLKYESLLIKILPYKIFLIVFFILILIGSAFLVKKIRFVLYPNDENQEVQIRLKGQDGFTLNQMNDQVKKLEDIIVSQLGGIGPVLESIITTVGSSNIAPTDTGNNKPNRANMILYLVSSSKRSETSAQIIQKLDKTLKNKSPFYQWLIIPYIYDTAEVQLFIKEPSYASFVKLFETFKAFKNARSNIYLGFKNWYQEYVQKDLRVTNKDPYKIYRQEIREWMNMQSGFLGLNVREPRFGPGQKNPVEIDIVGNDDQLREKALLDLYEYMNNIPGLFSLEETRADLESELFIKLDTEMMAKLGVTASDIAQSVKVAFLGGQVGSISKADESIAIMVILAKEDREKISTIGNIPIPNKYNTVIPLSKVATFELHEDLTRVVRTQGRRVSTLSADVDSSIIDGAGVANLVEQYIPQLMVHYPGIGFEIKGEAESAKESQSEAFLVTLIGLTGIFFTLLLVFKSVSQPLIILSIIPFGIVGVIIAFFLHGEPFSFFALLGMIGLIGVVINDAIVMITFINELKETEEGKEMTLLKMVSKGAAERIRPIVLTSLTTIVGLLPTIYGWGGSISVIRPLAMSLAYGILFGTLITLFLVPSFYILNIDIQKRIKNLFLKLARK